MLRLTFIERAIRKLDQKTEHTDQVYELESECSRAARTQHECLENAHGRLFNFLRVSLTNEKQTIH